MKLQQLILLVPVMLLSSTLWAKDVDTITCFDFTGETVKGITRSGDTMHVILEGLDCPEADQPSGIDVQSFIKNNVIGKEFVVYKIEYHNRDLIRLYSPQDSSELGRMKTFLTLSLLYDGVGWFTPEFNVYANVSAVKFCKKEKIGIWKNPNPIAPWKWREMSKEEKKKAWVEYNYWKSNETK